MKTKSLLTYLLFGFMIIMLAAFMAGCTGDDGKTGAQGPPGPPGEDGQDAVALADIVAINPVLDLTRTVDYDAATGTLTIHFFLTDEDGVGIDVTRDAYELRVYVSELIPGLTPPDVIPAGTIDPGPAWNQLFNERGTPAADSPMPGTLTLVDATTGEYTYVCDNTIPATTNVIRATVRARWRETINGVRYVFANPVNASYDFLQSDPGTPLASSGADMVTTAACQSCHSEFFNASPTIGHGGGYTQVKTCNHCHNVNYMATRDLEADLAHMIHRIHNAGVFTDLGDFSEVTYPQHIYTCAKCHDGPEADLAYRNPTRRNCGSCHDDVDFDTGLNHDGGARADDSGCAFCHTQGDIQQIHNPAPAPENDPEFDVTITMTPPANGGAFYVAGDAPIVTVTLVDRATGQPVAGTVYTADQDGEGAENLTEGLSLAELAVYGPRSQAQPVLATNTQHDPAFVPPSEPGGAPPTQRHSLFLHDIDGVANPDPLVVTNATGYRYQLLAIPVGMPGTYMVRFEGADYGGVTDPDTGITDYVTSSSAAITFQIGTATEEPKVSGDACIDCHGATIMHLEGAHAHHAPFNTDHCLACHDLSGNYGDYIGNRVHAVHRATVTGDTHNRDWYEVTFPRPANNCTTCHTNPDAETPVWRTPSMLACGGCHGTMPLANPDNPDYYTDLTPEQAAAKKEVIRREVGAAQHMESNGGDVEADAQGLPATLQCLICHGEGKIADLFVTHHLITFRPLPVDPNE